MIGDLKRVAAITKSNESKPLVEVAKNKSNILFSYLFVQNKRSLLQSEDLAYPYWYLKFGRLDTANMVKPYVSATLSYHVDKLTSLPNKSKYFNLIENSNYLYESKFIFINSMDAKSSIYVGFKGYFLAYDYFVSNFAVHFYNNILWLVFFYLIVIIVIYKIIKLRSVSKDQMIILLLSLIYIISIATVTIGHNRYLPRYEYPTSFLIYIIVALFPLIFEFKINIKENAFK